MTAVLVGAWLGTVVLFAAATVPTLPMLRRRSAVRAVRGLGEARDRSERHRALVRVFMVLGQRRVHELRTGTLTFRGNRADAVASLVEAVEDDSSLFRLDTQLKPLGYDTEDLSAAMRSAFYTHAPVERTDRTMLAYAEASLVVAVIVTFVVIFRGVV